MPGSAVGSVSSAGSSTSSKRARTKQYHRVNRTSEVDETLFASPNRTKRGGDGDQQQLEEQQASPPRSGRSSIRSMGQKSRKPAPKEEVRIITKDLIRNLIIPSDDPSGQSVILTGDEYGRIQQAARVLSQEERDTMFLRIKEEKEEKQDACSERKNFFHELDRTRHKNEKLNDLEEEAKAQAEYLLERAKEQREEQDDDIKYLNELILNAKCHAIRDAQMLEKGQVKQEESQEVKRLDIMMEVERQKAVKLQEEIDMEKKYERERGKQVILQQIEDNEEERMLEQERRDQEAVLMLKYLEKLQLEDLKALEKKHVQVKEAQKEIQRANVESEKQKVVRREQEVLADQKVLEYMRQKGEREAAFEAEQLKKKAEKEREVARLRAMQERAKDYQAEKDALRAKRNQEELERDWRRKERQEAIKKAETEAMLKEAREVQVANKEHFLAVQAARQRAEFEKVLRAQTVAVEKDQLKETSAKKKRLTNADDVRRQIREKEQIKIAQRNAFFQEGIKINEEAQERRVKLDQMKRKKLDALRAAGIPDKYCAEVERKINAPVTVNTK